MNRLTIDKPVEEMGMRELAHNSCYAKDRQAFYRDYDKAVDARELAKNLVEAYGADYEYTGDMEQFEEELFDSLQYGLNDITGLIAFIYRQLYAQADLYEVLKAYEDTGLTPEQIPEMSQMFQAKCEEVNRYEKLKEQGRLIELPCRVGDTVHEILSYRDCELDYDCVFDSENEDEEHECDGCTHDVIRTFIAEKSFNLRMFADLGKTVFATREEAEKALEANEQDAKQE